MTGPAESAGEDPGRSRHEWRIVLVMAGLFAAYLTVAGSMAMTALGDPSEPAGAGAVPAPKPVRGAITDRTGQLLAANLPAWALYTDARLFEPGSRRDPAATAAALAPVLPGAEAGRLAALLASERSFVWLARPVTPEQKRAVMELRPAIPGLEFGRRDMRVYPAGRMAAHLLGSVKTGHEGVHAADLIGSAGVEAHFDGRLRDADALEEPLALSIHLGVQSAVTEELAAGMARTGAKGAAAVLLDVHTGEVLSLVSLPDFDPNLPVTSTGGRDRNPRFNRAVSGLYELGSVFKPITAAMALEAGLVTPATLIETGTRVRSGGHSIRDMHRMPDAMTVTDIIRRSSNIGTARLARRVGTPRFREFLDALGLLAPLPLELPEAQAARPMKPRRWTELSTLTMSFGHGLSISPLQLTAAYATLANGGRRVIPSLVKGGRPLGERVFSERVARETVEMLRSVVADGTGRRTDVPGYSVGGKTGTADKARPGGGYYRDRTIASFAAVFPTTAPKYAILVLLDEPTDPETGSRQASRTAVPVMARTIGRVAPLLGMRPVLPPVVPDGALRMDALR